METEVKKFINECLDKNWSQSSMNKLLMKLHQTGRPTVDCKPDSCKTRKMGIAEDVIQLRSWYYVKKIPWALTKHQCIGSKLLCC